MTTNWLAGRKDIYSHSSGGWEAKIQVLRGAPYGGKEGETAPGLASSFWWPEVFLDLWPSSPCVFALSSLCLCLYVQISPFYKDISPIGLGPTLMTSFEIDYLS